MFIVLCKLPSWQVVSTRTSPEQKDRLIKNQPNKRPPSKPGSFKCYFQVAVKTIALETMEMSRTSCIPWGGVWPSAGANHTAWGRRTHALNFHTSGRQHLHTISPSSHEEKKTNYTSAWQHWNAGRPIESPCSISPHLHNVTPAIGSVTQAAYLWKWFAIEKRQMTISKYRNASFWMKVCGSGSVCICVCHIWAVVA